MTRFQFFTAAILIGMVGCSAPAPEKAQPAPAAVVKEAVKDDRPVVVAFGDSLTAGYGLEAGQSYPDLLQKMLDEKGYRYRVVSEGLSGDTTSGGVSRLELVVAQKPVVVILELGGNDGLRGIPVASTRENLDQMMTAILKSGARLVLAGITLPRNYGADYIREFDRIYPELSKKHKATLIPFLLDGVVLKPGLMQGDGIHPNAEGTKVVAGNVYRALAPLLAKQ